MRHLSVQDLGAFALALLIWGSIAGLALSGRPVPDVFTGAGGIVVGYFFRGAINGINNARRS